MLYRTEFPPFLHKKALSDSGLDASISNSQLSFHSYAYFDMCMHSYANIVAYLILGRQHHCPIEPFYAAKPFSPSDRAFLCMSSLATRRPPHAPPDGPTYIQLVPNSLSQRSRRRASIFAFIGLRRTPSCRSSSAVKALSASPLSRMPFVNVMTL